MGFKMVGWGCGARIGYFPSWLGQSCSAMEGGIWFVSVLISHIISSGRLGYIDS